MAHEVVERVEQLGPKLAALAYENEKLRRLGEETVAPLRVLV
ncbi:hypothetical protein ACFRAO_30335 [Streptomyces sp. NPDC056656]